MNDILRALYDADQGDRLQGRLSSELIAQRDLERRLEVRRLLAEGQAADGWDHYWAAVVMIHSRDAADVELSFELASRALELDREPLQIRAFYALAKDRLLLGRDEPQWYGTQKIFVDGQVRLAPIDPGAVTDEQRAAHGVLTLAERYREIEKLNRRRA